MAIANLARATRLYMRAELLILQIRFRLEAHRLMLLVFAAVLAVLGLGLLNLAFYAALESVWGPVWTPLALGIIDLGLAAIAVTIAALRKPGPELAVAEEMRSVAGTALEEQFQSGIPGANMLAGLTGSSDNTMLRLLVPIATALIGAVRRRKAAS